MRFTQFEDPFKYRQPEMTFSQDLARPYHKEIPPHWNEDEPSADEVDFSHVALDISFEDELLETAYDDFKKFLSVMQIRVDDLGKKIVVRKGETECFEAYIIRVERDGCEVIAADTEGIRRALVYIEDEMLRRSGSRLPLGEIKRRPFIRERISRCYFTPASTVEIDERENELIDDIDYYPDEYLNRLAHDGVNALWLGATIQHLVKSDIVPEYGADSEKRLAKLNRTIEKCRRYGIKTYLFSVDPASTYMNEKLKNHPDMLSDEESPWIYHLCPSTEKGLAYIKEAYSELFRRAPGLSGYLNLSVGEAESHCASGGALTCKRCREKFGTLGKTLAFVEKTISDTIKSVSPNAEYVSWTYAQRGWKKEDIEESCLLRDKSVRHLVNFEDLGLVDQLGEKRLAYDYWLSYAGPGQLFEDAIGYDSSVGVETWAKIQVCSSHEISTVPYVPVPSLLYEKYKYMHEHSVRGVMQCWYFGNYPCLMSRAAGELAFEPFMPTEREFLLHLCGIYWGKDAPKAADAFEKLARGYRNFPVGVDFEWYSPMQDSPVAPYHLEPIDLPMPATWTLDDMVGADRVWDCVLDSHTPSEILTLTSELSRLWNEGCRDLSSIGDFSTETRREQLTVATAANYIFESGVHTFEFYDLREKLALEDCDKLEVLDQMKQLVLREIEISRALIPITKEDNRIGYHSEAHGYKIFPEKLEWRIGELEKLLETEFPEVERRIANGEMPLPFYYGLDEGSRAYTVRECDISEAEWLDFISDVGPISDKTRIRAARNGDRYTVEILLDGVGDWIRIDPEFKVMHRSVPMFLWSGMLEIQENTGYSMFGERLERRRKAFDLKYTKNDDSESYAFSFNMRDLSMKRGEPFRLMIRRNGKRGDVLCPDGKIFYRLVVGGFSPDAFCFFVPN